MGVRASKACAKSLGGAMGALICGIEKSWTPGRPDCVALAGVRGMVKSMGAVRGADGKLELNVVVVVPVNCEAVDEEASRDAPVAWLLEESVEWLDRYWLRRSRPRGSVAEAARFLSRLCVVGWRLDG
jgi:hypothetical protein